MPALRHCCSVFCVCHWRICSMHRVMRGCCCSGFADRWHWPISLRRDLCLKRVFQQPRPSNLLKLDQLGPSYAWHLAICDCDHGVDGCAWRLSRPDSWRHLLCCNRCVIKFSDDQTSRRESVHAVFLSVAVSPACGERSLYSVNSVEL